MTDAAPDRSARRRADLTLVDGITPQSWGTVAIAATLIGVVHLVIVLAGMRGRAAGYS